MSYFLQIPEVVSHIFHFIDKNTTKQISSVNRLFHATAEYQLSHSLKSKWEKTFEEFQLLKDKFEKCAPWYSVNETVYVDHQTGYIYFTHTEIDNNFKNSKGTLYMSHFFDSRIKLFVHKWGSKIIPSIVILPAYLSKSGNSELYLSLNNIDEFKGSDYISLTNILQKQIIHSHHHISKKKSLKFIQRLPIFHHWAPFWSDLVDTKYLDGIDEKMWKLIDSDLGHKHANRFHCSVSITEFYLIVFTKSASKFLVYSFCENQVQRKDVSALIRQNIQPSVNILQLSSPTNNQQWLTIQSLNSPILVLNLKTLATLNFPNYPNSIYQSFITFNPEPILLFAISYSQCQIRLLTQNDDKFLTFGDSSMTYFHFEEPTGTIMSLDLLLNQTKRVKLYSINEILKILKILKTNNNVSLLKPNV